MTIAEVPLAQTVTNWSPLRNRMEALFGSNQSNNGSRNNWKLLTRTHGYRGIVIWHAVGALKLQKNAFVLTQVPNPLVGAIQYPKSLKDHVRIYQNLPIAVRTQQAIQRRTLAGKKHRDILAISTPSADSSNPPTVTGPQAASASQRSSVKYRLLEKQPRPRAYLVTIFPKRQHLAVTGPCSTCIQCVKNMLLTDRIVKSLLQIFLFHLNLVVGLMLASVGGV